MRGLLEFFREGWNWTVGGLPTAQIIGIAIVIIGVAWLMYNHRRGSRPYAYLPPYVAPPPPELATEPAFDPDADEDDDS